MMCKVKISDDGATVGVLRGELPIRSGWAPNPRQRNPNGLGACIHGAARTAGGSAWRVVDAGEILNIAPDGKLHPFIKDNRFPALVRTKPAPGRPRRKGLHHRMGRGQASRGWSPEEKKIRLVRTRVDHSFIMVYDVAHARV